MEDNLVEREGKGGDKARHSHPHSPRYRHAVSMRVCRRLSGILTEILDDQIWSSKTGFAKVWLQLYPLRAMVVYDDDDDVVPLTPTPPHCDAPCEPQP